MNTDLLSYASQIIESYALVGCAGYYLGDVEIIRAVPHIHPIFGPIKDRRRAPLSFTGQADIITLMHKDFTCIVLELRSI